jgi:hypothetical protein
MLQYSLIAACVQSVEIASKTFTLYLHWLKKQFVLVSPMTEPEYEAAGPSGTIKHYIKH